MFERRVGPQANSQRGRPRLAAAPEGGSAPLATSEGRMPDGCRAPPGASPSNGHNILDPGLRRDDMSACNARATHGLAQCGFHSKPRTPPMEAHVIERGATATDSRYAK